MNMFRNAAFIAMLLFGGSALAATGQLISVTAIPGPANCANGGVQIDVGMDDGVPGGTASDGILDAQEIDGTNYVCNGATGPAGADGADGVDGANGADGADGTDGIHCWDTNLNGINDPAEDVNTDMAWNTLDCIGPQGPAGADGADGVDGTNGADGADGADGLNGLACWDLNGDGVQDTEEDINSDMLWNAVDCIGMTGPQGPAGADGAPGADGTQGPQGPAGADGADGLNGLACWDLNGDGIQDTIEDINADMAWDTLDCIGPQGPAGADGTDGTDGTNGANGIDGLDGSDGLACWDLNEDGFADDIEDINDDGVWNALDCIGPQGPSGDDGAVGPQGPAGVAGPQGPQGPQGDKGDKGDKGDPGDAGATGSAGTDGTDGVDGANGRNALVATTDEEPGDNCANGGKKIDTGIDDDGDGTLDAEEIDTTEYVCNGAAGTDGEDGENGENGTAGSNGLNALVATAVEEPGENCEYGGFRIESGLDADGDGELEETEVNDQATRYVCNGAPGATVEQIEVTGGGGCSLTTL